MRHLSLFSGIGGLDLAAEWAGFETVGFCEIDTFCQKVLAKHWPGVKIYDDVKKITVEQLRTDGLLPVDIISGGFPCQPFSTAGQRKGEDDERHLWPQMLRVIREVRPRWVLGENVRGLLSIDSGRTFGRILSDLAESGYRVGWVCYGAADVGAPHQRDRVFIMAYSDSEQTHEQLRRPRELGGQSRQPVATREEASRQTNGTPSNDNTARLCDVLANAESLLPQGQHNGPGQEQSRGSSWWSVEPDVGRVANGVPARVDRLKSLGNAVVPQQAYPIFKAIMEIERGFS